MAAALGSLWYHNHNFDIGRGSRVSNFGHIELIRSAMISLSAILAFPRVCEDFLLTFFKKTIEIQELDDGCSLERERERGVEGGTLWAV